MWKYFYLNAARGYEKKSLKCVIKLVQQTCAEQLISGVEFEIDTDIKSLHKFYFLTYLYIPPWLWKILKSKLLRSVENGFASQKFESRHFCYPRKISDKLLIPPVKGED